MFKITPQKHTEMPATRHSRETMRVNSYLMRHEAASIPQSLRTYTHTPAHYTSETLCRRQHVHDCGTRSTCTRQVNQLHVQFIIPTVYTALTNYHCCSGTEVQNEDGTGLGNYTDLQRKGKSVDLQWKLENIDLQWKLQTEKDLCKVGLSEEMHPYYQMGQIPIYLVFVSLSPPPPTPTPTHTFFPH